MAKVNKRKIIILSSFCGALLLAYILTFVFDPENSAARGAFWTALDPKLKDDVRQIELAGDAKVSLVNEDGRWFVSFEDALYPALQDKVAGMLDTLTGRGSYPVRSRSEAAQEKLTLTDKEARSIVVRGASGDVLLKLLVGAPDAMLKDVYIRLEGSNEIRSGADLFSPFFGARKSWYELHLFPDRGVNGLNSGSVQRVIIQPPPPEITRISIEGEGGDFPVLPEEGYTLVRNDGGWHLDGSEEALDGQAVETYIRRIIECAADDFTPIPGANDAEFTDPAFPSGKLVLEAGNGARRTVTIGPKVAGKFSAAVSGSPYVYLLTNLQLEQLFQRSDSFIK
ncbi:MAG: DUF4340 domain-containing protein [Spirochaetaceae bacterium]|jgi:hypothetical protein|nr:DUF4340 domain-containing protein [Spirochaetaceae bacterium]